MSKLIIKNENNYIVSEEIRRELSNYSEIVFEDCIICNLDLGGLFLESVTIQNCLILEGNLVSTNFCGGLLLESSIIKASLDFQAGGHNRKDCPIIFRNNIFMDVINFFDCWFTGPFQFERNILNKDSNLLGNEGKAWEVKFDIAPTVINNIGNVNCDFD